MDSVMRDAISIGKSVMRGRGCQKLQFCPKIIFINKCSQCVSLHTMQNKWGLHVPSCDGQSPPQLQCVRPKISWISLVWLFWPKYIEILSLVTYVLYYMTTTHAISQTHSIISVIVSGPVTHREAHEPLHTTLLWRGIHLPHSQLSSIVPWHQNP